MNPIALLLALLVHALVLVPIEVEHRKEPTKPAQITLSDLPSFKFRAGTSGHGLACDDTYEGVGLRDSWAGVIGEVAEGGPAARAGVQVGDELVTYKDEGPYRVIRVRRDGQTRVLRLRREVICQDRA